jgi:hypothetical protein
MAEEAARLLEQTGGFSFLRPKWPPWGDFKPLTGRGFPSPKISFGNRVLTTIGVW